MKYLQAVPVQVCLGLFSNVACICAMSHHLQESAGSAVALQPQHPVPAPIDDDSSTSQHASGSGVARHVCGSNMRCFLNVSCICAMSHHLQKIAGSAVAPQPQHPVPAPIEDDSNDSSTSKHAPGSGVSRHVCGNNMRCFLNVSCTCAMSHHLQESARKNTQKTSKSIKLITSHYLRSQ